MPGETFTAPRSRREKRLEARKATEMALRHKSRVTTVGEEKGLYGEILGVIREQRFADFPLDQRDISLAVRWLHNHGIVRMWHRGPEQEREHGIHLVKS